MKEERSSETEVGRPNETEIGRSRGKEDGNRNEKELGSCTGAQHDDFQIITSLVC